ncbi:hypothetical protein EJB05_50133, partial [Eragrostis curvula]
MEDEGLLWEPLPPPGSPLFPRADAHAGKDPGQLTTRVFGRPRQREVLPRVGSVLTGERPWSSDSWQPARSFFPVSLAPAYDARAAASSLLDDAAAGRLLAARPLRRIQPSSPAKRAIPAASPSTNTTLAELKKCLAKAYELEDPKCIVVFCFPLHRCESFRL